MGSGLENLRLKRVYAPADAQDGYRVLVDRLWPRGVRRDALALDAWLRDLAPSDALRRWCHDDASRWGEFVARYRKELEAARAVELLADLRVRARGGPVTLLYAARDPLRNHAIVLRGEIERVPGEEGGNS